MSALKTLFHPFETGDIDLPPSSARGLFLNAQPGLRLPAGFPESLAYVQGFRPGTLALARERRAVTPQADGADYDFALVLTDRHRGANELRIAEALERVRQDGLIVVAGSKDDGIASLRKRMGALVGVDGFLSKFHGQAFWFRRTENAPEVARGLRAANAQGLVDGRFHTAPGMFSHERVDPGSRLLAANIPRDATGRAADFAAGWGYLSAELAARAPGIAAIDLYEADFASLEAARRNLEPIALGKTLDFHWHDLVGEPVTETYSLIVMNPPFHQGRAAEPGIGQALIKRAAGALKKNGRLVMVANIGLPYREPLAQAFAKVSEPAQEGGFRIYDARK